MNFVDIFQNLWKSTGIFNMILPADPNLSGAEQIMHMYGAPIMFLVCLVLLYLGIKKEFEPLLLVPIAFGGILANIPVCDIAGPKGFLGIVYEAGIHAGLFPLFIFMGVGAMTDFGPLIANPKTALLGGAAQFGIFQPPIMKMLTTKKERLIEMTQMREVSQREKIVFPLLVLGLCIILLPDACPLVGALAFGNLCKESGVVERLSKTLQNEFINIVTILLGLSVGSKLQASQFLTVQTLYILVLGLLAFSFATGMGVIFGKIMNKCSKTPINPLIGAAGVSAVPMAARVVNKVGLEYNPNNYLLMHAMGPNVAGVIGSAVAAGVLLAICS